MDLADSFSGEDRWTILLDMDGVLCNFIQSTCEAMQIPYHLVCDLYTSRPSPVYALHELLYENRKMFKPYVINRAKQVIDVEYFMWCSINRLGSAFWSNMLCYPWARALWTELRTLGDVVFCSTPAQRSASVAGKLEWLYHFSGNWEFRDYVFITHKHLLARRRTILIDDSPQKCAEFMEGTCSSLDCVGAAHGAYLFPQLWNERRTEAARGYTEPTLFADMVVREVADIIGK